MGDARGPPRRRGRLLTALERLDGAGDLFLDAEGRRVVGSSEVTWHCTSGSGPRVPARARLTVTRADGESVTATVVSRELRPFAATLRQGLDVELSTGARVRVERNGPRPLAVLRRLTVASARFSWVAQGRAVGVEMREVDTARPVLRSFSGVISADPALPTEQAATLHLLVAMQIPQSLALTGFRGSL